MTAEEAGQEILEGPYTTCTRCKGQPYGKDQKPLATFFNCCQSCKGSGKWLRGDYKTACIVLGMDIPAVPEAVSNWKFDPKVRNVNFVDYSLSDAQMSAEFMSKYKREYVGEWATSDD